MKINRLLSWLAMSIAGFALISLFTRRTALAEGLTADAPTMPDDGIITDEASVETRVPDAETAPVNGVGSRH